MRNIYTFFILLLVTIGLTSCDSGSSPMPPFLVEDNSVKGQIIGTWDGIEVCFDDGDWINITKYPYDKFGFSVTFNEDNTYYGDGWFGTGYGTYTVNKNIIQTYIAGSKYFTYIVNNIVYDFAEVTVKDNTGDSMEVRVMRR